MDVQLDYRACLEANKAPPVPPINPPPRPNPVCQLLCNNGCSNSPKPALENPPRGPLLPQVRGVLSFHLLAAAVSTGAALGPQAHPRSSSTGHTGARFTGLDLKPHCALLNQGKVLGLRRLKQSTCTRSCEYRQRLLAVPGAACTWQGSLEYRVRNLPGTGEKNPRHDNHE